MEMLCKYLLHYIVFGDNGNETVHVQFRCQFFKDIFNAHLVGYADLELVDIKAPDVSLLLIEQMGSCFLCPASHFC